jgi:hypothetical protein
MKYLKKYNEMIKIPIKVGDTVLGGRFKNKKVVVKKIGKNDKGDITINDKPLLKYRIVKESASYDDLKNNVEDYLAHLKDDGFMLYSDIKTRYIDYPKIIVQIDSFHRITCEFDILIFDECEYVMFQIGGIRDKNLNDVWNKFLLYTKYTDKVFLMDALLTNTTYNFFANFRQQKSDHECIKLHNLYKPYE